MTRLPRASAATLLLALAWLPGAGASAHPLAPSLLELVETSPGRFAVTWKTPLQQPAGADVRPRLPEHCRPVGEGEASREGTGLVLRSSIDCSEAGIVGHTVAVDGLASTGTNALARVVLHDGRRLQAVLTADAPALEVRARQSALDVARDYAGLGIEHILGGLDHLAFVFGLMLLVDGRRKLIATVTAFTLGHSVTLSLAVLGFVSFPSAVVELVIAGTILALALELARPVRGGSGRSWMRRVPWAMAFGFGLLHGLGFAGALAEVGLPADEIPAALVSFNLGIEVGQLVFVLAVLALRRVLAGPLAAAPPALLRAPVYAMGGLAVYWCLDRGAGLL